MENKQGGTAGISRPCMECFRVGVDFEIEGHSGGMSFLFPTERHGKMWKKGRGR